MDQTSIDHVKGIVEALLFVNEKPVTLQQIKEVAEGVDLADLKQIIQVLMKDYEEKKSGMLIVEIAGGYQMLTNPLYASYVRSFYKTRHKEKLSKPSLETLAIIAYKQPVTRADVEMIRGVNSDGVMVHLLNKELIKAVGRKDVAGRPFLYGTTKQFLEYFGLKSLSDLPRLEDFPSLQQSAEGEAASGSSQEVITSAEASSELQGVSENSPASEESQAVQSSRLDEIEKESEGRVPLIPDLKQAMKEVGSTESEEQSSLSSESRLDRIIDSPSDEAKSE